MIPENSSFFNNSTFSGDLLLAVKCPHSLIGLPVSGMLSSVTCHPHEMLVPYCQQEICFTLVCRSAPSQAAAAPAGGPPGGPGNPGDGGPTQPVNTTSNRRLQQTQAQVDEVVDIMRVNVDKVLERDQKLSELDDRADALQAGASQFETSAAKLKRKYWWKNCKMMIILGAICAFIIIIIIIYFCT
ncbi:vesicle-associated membrane protein 2-like [Chiloscyllium plagiosum]|uniref:vesicle-associated membrane protein 2-like n=1 Tax=Chiloscyllium plagiosum TaxID=36176 RepID=UPI001CB7CD4B|nr:vesicle-associated membrane protein 2-like [Chiloscyllium plagiosum]